MAVLTRPCAQFPCLPLTFRAASSRHGMILRTVCSAIKTQLCTVGVTLTLFNTARLPREAFRYGAIPYLVVYSMWLVIVGLASALLQLAAGQLSQQDAVGVWRAVPIFRGVGHIQLLTSYLACVYHMLYATLAASYMLWIGKDTFPLRACTKLQMTPNGYENKVNATECFESTFLSPVEQHPHYMAIMAIIVFVLWFFVPVLLYGLKKTFKMSTSLLSTFLIVFTIVIAVFLSRAKPLEDLILSCEEWAVFTQPHIWFSSLVQAGLSTMVGTGYLVTSGGTIYRHSDVRWVSTKLIFCNLFAGWLWVVFWQSIGGLDEKETEFLSVLVLIYQSSISEGRTKMWPILLYGLILVSGIMTILFLLYPIYDRLQRFTGDKWKLVAGVASLTGTILTLGVMVRAVNAATVLDELVVPILVIFSMTFQIVGFVFIYGCRLLRNDVEFLTGVRTSGFWAVMWWLAPALMLGVTGWWLRVLLDDAEGHVILLWPLGAALVAILLVMAVIAAIAVAKEEQYNLCSKIAGAFRPSRLWGPEDPSVRYNWMVQRYNDELSYNDGNSEASYSYSQKLPRHGHEKHDWTGSNSYQRNYNIYPPSNDSVNTKSAFNPNQPGFTYTVPVKSGCSNTKFTSPNICMAKNELDSNLECNCNRHFTLNVPMSMQHEVTTSL